MNKELKHAFEINTEVTMDNIKQVMRSSEYTDRELAMHMNFEVKTINNWLNGRTYPNFDIFDYLCRLLNCDPKDIIVRNYQIEYPTLSEQIKFFRRQLVMANRYYDECYLKDDSVINNDSDKAYDKLDIQLIILTLEELESPAWNINEIMSYMQLMSPKAIYYIIRRLINVGISDNDTSYIRHTINFVIKKLIPNSRKKKELANEINYKTHRPFFLKSTDKSKSETLKIFKNYKNNFWEGAINEYKLNTNSPKIDIMKILREEAGIQISLDKFIQSPEQYAKKARKEDVYIIMDEKKKIVLLNSDKYEYYKPAGYDNRPMYYHSTNDNR